MYSRGLKNLSNYQLLELITNPRIDSISRQLLNKEYNLRNLSTNEVSRIEKQYKAKRVDLNPIAKHNLVSPIITPFLLNRHFKQIAFLIINGRNKEAKIYSREIMLGLTLYYLVIIVILIINF